jgi:hypothetical protein
VGSLTQVRHLQLVVQGPGGLQELGSPLPLVIVDPSF